MTPIHEPLSEDAAARLVQVAGLSRSPLPPAFAVALRTSWPPAAHAEVPPSRTLRVIGSVLIEPTEQADVVNVHSATIMYRQRGHDEQGDIIPYRRVDTLKITEQGARLLKRKAVLTEAVLRTPNLGVFL